MNQNPETIKLMAALLYVLRPTAIEKVQPCSACRGTVDASFGLSCLNCKGSGTQPLFALHPNAEREAAVVAAIELADLVDQVLAVVIEARAEKPA